MDLQNIIITAACFIAAFILIFITSKENKVFIIPGILVAGFGSVKILIALDIVDLSSQILKWGTTAAMLIVLVVLIHVMVCEQKKSKNESASDESVQDAEITAHDDTDLNEDSDDSFNTQENSSTEEN